MHLVWAGALGWLVFGQLPDALGLTGMAIVALAGVTAALRGQFQRG
jgi:drug/metabolite transporter (DMT)-like permease